MKKQIVLLCCSLSFFGSAQNIDTIEKLDKNLSSTNYNFLINSIGRDNEDVNPERQLNYGICINQSLTLYGLPTAVLFTLHYKNHQFDLGPQFRLGVPFRKEEKYIGVEFNYRYYPHGDTTWFNPYLFFNAGYFNEFSKRLGTYTSNDPALNTQPTIYTNKTHNLVLNIGYGVKFTLVGGFYLGSHVGFGMYSYSNLYERKMTQLDWNSIDKTGDVNLGFLASVFIGYKF